MDVITIETAQLGNRSYILHDGSNGLVVDPVRDVERIELEAERVGVRIVAVAETHIHNDYVSGGLELARRHAADYLVAADESVEFSRRPVRDGSMFDVGDLTVEVVGTPGHTPHHLAFLASADEAEPVLFSGGSLLYGTVGRTDLVAPQRTEELTRQQFRSAHRLAERLPASTLMYPTHGFGSFCASGSTATAFRSTIGEQLRSNDALRTDDENAFVETLIRRLGPYPYYYAAMAPLNRVGAPPIDLTDVATLTPAELRVRAKSNLVVDLRSREDFASAHLPGAISVEYGKTFATYVGWVLPWGVELTLLGDSPEQLDYARRDLALIGVEWVSSTSADRLDVSTHGQLVGYPRARWEDLRDAKRASANGVYDVDYDVDGIVDDIVDGRENHAHSEVVVDVRRVEEYLAGHLEGAVSVPIHELPDRIRSVPAGRLWVHCQSGYRAGIAASLFHRAGRDVVHIDDEFQRAQGIGLRIAELETPRTGS